MTDYSKIDFSPIIDASVDEVVTESFVRDVQLPSGGTLALITLDNGRDHTRPNTLGPRTLQALGAVLDAQRSRATATGKCAGARARSIWICCSTATWCSIRRA